MHNQNGTHIETEYKSHHVKIVFSPSLGHSLIATVHSFGSAAAAGARGTSSSSPRVAAAGILAGAERVAGTAPRHCSTALAVGLRGRFYRLRRHTP